MRMVDKESLVNADDRPAPSWAAPAPRSRRRIRFTSNVVGTLYLLTDILCFVVSVPLALAAYSFVRSANYAVSVHVTAFILMLGSFLLIRLSRQAYRRSLLDLRDSSDTHRLRVAFEPSPQRGE